MLNKNSNSLNDDIKLKYIIVFKELRLIGNAIVFN